MPEIVLLSGIPCSGKSSYMKKYLPNYRVISRDEIRLGFTLTGKYGDYVFSNQNEKRVTCEFNKQYFFAVGGLKEDIVLDNTYCKESYIDEELSRYPKKQYYTFRIIFFDCPLWKAYIRNIVRYLMTGKWIPFEVIRNMKKNFEKINKEKYALYL